MAGLYVHIPFCVRKCNYCDFYSVPGKLTLLDRYVEAVLLEAEQYHGTHFDTLYIGGGTPSLLGAGRLEILMQGLSQQMGLVSLREATIEVNPESASDEFLKTARSLGFDRVSIGVQSLSDEELAKSGRIHDARTAVAAIDGARHCGFSNISADIIVGLPGQTDRMLSNTLAGLGGLGITHLSMYCLSIEENTPFSADRPPDLVDDEGQAILFEHAAEHLMDEGFIHYEISNFALPGRECLHNLNYWRGGEYIGLGPSAASHIAGVRSKNASCLEAYIENPLDGECEREALGPDDKMAEEAILRLRLLAEGLELAVLQERHPVADISGLKERLDKMVGEGMLAVDGGRYRLPEGGVMTSNRVFVRVLN